MAKTVVGLFDDFAEAQSVVQDLVNAGFSRNDISIAANQTASGYTGDGTTGTTTGTGEGHAVGKDAGIGAGIGGVGRPAGRAGPRSPFRASARSSPPARWRRPWASTSWAAR